MNQGLLNWRYLLLWFTLVLNKDVFYSWRWYANIHLVCFVTSTVGTRNCCSFHLNRRILTVLPRQGYIVFSLCNSCVQWIRVTRRQITFHYKSWLTDLSLLLLQFFLIFGEHFWTQFNFVASVQRMCTSYSHFLCFWWNTDTKRLIISVSLGGFHDASCPPY